MSVPSGDDDDDVLLSCRYGELEEVEEYISRFGIERLSAVRDDNGSTVLHMLCGNGHSDILDFILPLLPSSSLLSVQNKAGSTALHWAALNQHLQVMQKLIDLPGGPGVDLIDIKNAAGRSPLTEAEMAGWNEGSKWLVEVMNLRDDETRAGMDDDEGVPPPPGTIDDSVEMTDVQVEIEDANGQVSKMTIRGTDTTVIPTT